MVVTKKSEKFSQKNELTKEFIDSYLTLADKAIIDFDLDTAMLHLSNALQLTSNIIKNRYEKNNRNISAYCKDLEYAM